MREWLKRFIRLLIYFHVFVAVGMLLTHCSFSHYANKSFERARKEKPFDVVIVPGVPYDKENTTSVMAMRLHWAKLLYDSGFARNFIFSGSAVYTPYVEAIAMKIIADSLGIPSDRTFFETKAEHSTENIFYSWKMAKKMGFKKIALASDPFQSGMLKHFIKKYTPGVRSIPIVFDRLNMEEQMLPTIDYSSAFVPGFVNIKKREGFWKRFRGTMGKRVKDEVRAEKKAEKQRNMNKEKMAGKD